METVSLVAGFITIVRAIRDILKRFKKHEEADALEEAAEAIQTKGEISESEAKKIFAQTLTKELGEEKARSLIQYTEAVETFFPFRPSGALLQYGVAIEQLVLQIHQVLTKLQAFELLGERLGSNRRLKFVQSGLPFYGIGGHSELLPSSVQVYSLGAHLYEYPYGHRPDVPIIAPEIKPSIKDYFVLEAQHSNQIFLIFVDVDESSPFSMIFSNEERKVEKRLEPYQFKYCVEALLSDTKSYVERVAQEFEKSREESQKFFLSMEALKKLASSS